MEHNVSLDGTSHMGTGVVVQYDHTSVITLWRYEGLKGFHSSFCNEGVVRALKRQLQHPV
jgi:hypothetical protein